MNTGIYGLIALTSKAMKKSVEGLGLAPKWPDPILEIQRDLAQAHDGDAAREVMEGFVAKYGK